MATLKFQNPALGELIPTGGRWYVEPKLDGVRLGAVRDGKGWRFFTKHGSCSCPPHIEKAMPWAPVGTFLDGEFVWKGGNREALSVLGRTDPPAVGLWFVFDALPEVPCRLDLERRKRFLERLLRGSKPPILEMAYTPVRTAGEIREEMAAVREAPQTEGVVLKLATSLYKPGSKSRIWRKFKWR